MFAPLTGVSYDSVGFGSWLCSDNAVIIVMAVCGNRITIAKCFITVCAVGISTVSAGSAGWRGVVTFCGMWVCTCFSGDFKFNRFIYIIVSICTNVNCGGTDRYPYF